MHAVSDLDAVSNLDAAISSVRTTPVHPHVPNMYTIYRMDK